MRASIAADRLACVGLVAALVLAVACGGSGNNPPPGDGGLGGDGSDGGLGGAGDGGLRSVGGVVSGMLGGGLVLANNGAGNLTIARNGRFAFAAPVAQGAAYAVTVATQPSSPAQSCLVRNGAGSAGAGDVTDVIVSCAPEQPRYLLVADDGDDSVSSYVVDAASGRVTFVGKAAAGLDPSSIAVTPGGQFAYATNSGDGTVSQWSIAASGELTPLSPATVAAGAGARGIAIDPTGKLVFVANSTGASVSAFTVGATGALTLAGTTTTGEGPGAGALAIDPTGAFLFVLNTGNATQGTISGYAVGPGGALTPLSPATTTVPPGPRALVCDPAGRFLYQASDGDGQGDGRLTQLSLDANGLLNGSSSGGVGVGMRPSGIAIDPTGRIVYVTSRTAGTVARYNVGAEGSLTTASTSITPTEAGPSAVVVDRTGKLAYVANAEGNSLSLFQLGAGGALPNPLPRVPAQVSPSAVALVTGDAPVQAVPRYVYVGNGGGTLSLYTVGTTGALAPLATVPVTGTGPQAITVDPAAHYAYVANSNTASLSQYAIGADGRLAALTPATVPSGGALPLALAIHPSGRYAYAANQFGRNLAQFQVARDGTLAALTPATVMLPAGTAQPTNLALDPSGRYLYLTLTGARLALFSVGNTGALTLVSDNAAPLDMSGSALAVAPSGRTLYVASGLSDSVATFLIGAAGALTPATPPTIGTGDTPAGLAIDPTGQNLYTANYNGADLSQFALAAGGTLSALSSLSVSAGVAGTDNPQGIAIDPSGRFVYVVDAIGPSGPILQYGRAADGTLHALTPPSVAGGDTPQIITIAGSRQ